MNKEALVALGITEEVAQKILGLHKSDINGNYIPKSRFDDVNEQLKEVRKQVEERDTQIAGLKKFEGTNKELTEKVKELQDQNKQKAAEFDKQLKENKVKNAVKASLGDSVHDSALVLGLVDLTKVELDDKDEIKSGLKEQLELLKKDKAFLFKDAPTKPNVKITGKTPTDGDNRGGADAPESFAKSLAQGNAAGTESAAKKAEDLYFGANK